MYVNMKTVQSFKDYKKHDFYLKFYEKWLKIKLISNEKNFLRNENIHQTKLGFNVGSEKH